MYLPKLYLVLEDDALLAVGNLHGIKTVNYILQLKSSFYIVNDNDHPSGSGNP